MKFLTTLILSFAISLIVMSILASHKQADSPYFLQVECVNAKGEPVLKDRVHQFALKAVSPKESTYFKCTITDEQ